MERKDLKKGRKVFLNPAQFETDHLSLSLSLSLARSLALAALILLVVIARSKIEHIRQPVIDNKF